MGSAVPLVDAVVADLFAGTGALGIEALSRGAAHAVFVDDDAAARRLIAENLRTCGFADRAEVRGGDAVAVAVSVAMGDAVVVGVGVAVGVTSSVQASRAMSSR